MLSLFLSFWLGEMVTETLYSIFTTREIAIGIIILLFFLYTCSIKKARPALNLFLKASFSKHIINGFIVVLAYAFLWVLIFSTFNFWKWIYLKDVILWTLFVGVPNCFNAVGDRPTPSSLKQTIITNLKFAALLEYVVNVFTFNLLIELVFQIVILFVYLLIAMAERKPEEYKDVSRFLNWVLVVIGYILFLLYLNKALDEFKSLNVIDELVTALTPIVLSMLFIPVIYFFSLYSLYQTVFFRLKIYTGANTELLQHMKHSVLRCCKGSLHKVETLKYYLPGHFRKDLTIEEFDARIQDFELQYAEKSLKT